MDILEGNRFIVEARAVASSKDRALLANRLPELARQASEEGDSRAAALLWLESALLRDRLTSDDLFRCLDLAVQEAAKAEEPEIAARACLERALRLEALGHIREAVEWAKRADAWAEASENRLVWGLVLLTLSRLFRWAGQLSEAEQAAEMVVVFGHEVDNSSLVQSGLIALAEARLALGHVSGAEEAALGAASLSPGHPATRAHILLLQGVCALRSGRPNEARDLLASARGLLCEAGADPSAVMGAELLEAQATAALGDLDGSAGTFRRVASSEFGLNAVAGADLLSVLAASGNRDEIPHLVQGVIEKARGCPIPRIRVLTLVQVGMALWSLGRAEDALSLVREALELARSEAPDLMAPARVLLDEMTCAATTGPGLA